MPSALLIHDAFLEYNALFSAITQKAKRHFEQRDWISARHDATARIELYDQCIAAISDKLSDRMADQSNNAVLWLNPRGQALPLAHRSRQWSQHE